jgi:hypothetical protein
MAFHAIRILAAFALIAGASITGTSPALSAPPRLEGEYCAAGRAPAGTWIGFFDGYEKETRFVSREDSYWPVTEWRCFNSKADCIAWKYWMQTDYRASQTWCRKK